MSNNLTRSANVPANRSGARRRAAAARASQARRGRLLALLRKLIRHGTQLLAELLRLPPPEELQRIGAGFGTRDIAVMIARSVRGMRLADALEDRILNSAALLDNRTARRLAATRPDNHPPPITAEARARRALLGVDAAANPPVAAAAHDAAAPFDHWPTSAEIAARICGRPIGPVLAEICHDLGVTSRHPLWWELLDSIDRDGGKYAHFTRYESRRPVTAGFDPFDPAPGPFSFPECGFPSRECQSQSREYRSPSRECQSLSWAFEPAADPTAADSSFDGAEPGTVAIAAEPGEDRA